MDLRETILTRRTVNQFTAEKIDEAIINQALELSLWAPNHRLTFPWAYRLLGPESRRQLADLAVELRAAKETVSPVKAQATRDVITTCSHLLALGARVGEKSEAVIQEDYATVACSVQIMSLVLWQNGVATKWSTSGWATHARAAALMGLDTSEFRLYGCLLIGRALSLPAPAQRPPLNEVLTRTT